MKRGTRALTSLFGNKSLPKSKRSQVSIFIIIGILIVVVIALVFVFREDIIPDSGGGVEVNLNSFLKTCLEDEIKETVEVISLQGGKVEPTLYKTFKFDEEDEFYDISFLCYNQNNYLQCINQEPMLIQNLKKELEKELEDEVESCFTDLGNSLDNQGFVVDARYRGFEIELMPRKIVIEIDGEMGLTKTENSVRYENFTISETSRFYDVAVVVQEIVNQEASFCYFDNLGYMLFYPEFEIDKTRTSDSALIYTIKYQDSEEKFRFAVRGCVMPPTA